MLLQSIPVIQIVVVRKKNHKAKTEKIRHRNKQKVVRVLKARGRRGSTKRKAYEKERKTKKRKKEEATSDPSNEEVRSEE